MTDLEAYWGIGPKTRATLETALGTEAAAAAIERGDLRTLVDAGVSQGRATRILRRAQNDQGMELLATRDTRDVYKSIIEAVVAHAVSEEAAARLRLLTPLTDRDAIIARQQAVQEARETWNGLDSRTKEAVLTAFEAHDPATTGERAAVETAVALHEADVHGPTFEPILQLDPAGLRDAASALKAMEGDRIAPGTDETLDQYRSARDDVDSLLADVPAVVDDLSTGGVRDTTGFREALVERLRTGTAADPALVREAMPTEAMDATAFVEETLRTLRTMLTDRIDTRATDIRSDLAADIEAVRDDIDRAQTAVDRVARDLSLARFASAYDLTRPEYGTEDGLAVEGARNLTLLTEDQPVQPITYAIGEHTLAGPTGDRVAVLTGANSGGKTTLLETLCQVTLLAHMGLPVPAAATQLSPFDRIVFHRRHASFNAGVLESTLQSIVPPLTTGERTLMLVDEFEAITEPGRAADLLNGLVQLTVQQNALGTFVTHLADELSPLPAAARIDGIFAQGLTEDLELDVDYQPRFGEVGRSTPEFIVSRLVANASTPAEQAGFQTLADAVNTDVVQRTLADARWQGE